MMTVFPAVIFLLSFLRGQTLDLHRATTAPGNAPWTPSVHCWCSSYPNITQCSWSQPPHHPPTGYIATYSERHGESITERCLLIPPTPSSSSSSSAEQMWTCRLNNLKLFTDYIINVTAVSSGRSSSFLHSFMLEDIVRPDPPVDVRVSPQNFKHLLVEWSPPSTWSHLDLFPLKYQIMYQWENKGAPKAVTLGPFERTRVELKGLTPGRRYQVQVCAMDLLGLGSCSTWSSAVNVTLAGPKN